MHNRKSINERFSAGIQDRSLHFLSKVIMSSFFSINKKWSIYMTSLFHFGYLAIFWTSQFKRRELCTALHNSITTHIPLLKDKLMNKHITQCACVYTFNFPSSCSNFVVCRVAHIIIIIIIIISNGSTTDDDDNDNNGTRNNDITITITNTSTVNNINTTINTTRTRAAKPSTKCNSCHKSKLR